MAQISTGCQGVQEADAHSDHFLIAASIWLELRHQKRQTPQRQSLDITIEKPSVRKEFVHELRN